MNKKVILTILDGWGIAPNKNVSAVDKANTPCIDFLSKNYPTASLRTDGVNVGLPDGQMGNSEVGHINLGSGRIVYQDLAKINLAIKNETLSSEKKLIEALKYAKKNNKPIHLLGLVSDGGVHSHINHLKGLVKIASDFGIKKTFVHAFTDGRDVDPKSGIHFIKDLITFLQSHQAQLASLIGRYYAMDRDKRWERISQAYQLLVHHKGLFTNNILQAIQESYDNGITDEFLLPIVHTHEGKPIAKIENGDVVIFFNFRTDRGRQLTMALSQQDYPEHDMKAMKLKYYTMTKYDDTFKNVSIIFEKENVKNTLGEVLAKNNKTQIRAAETEKYPHVTFFFSGGQEKTFEGEKRILVNSPKVATYDLKPEMSAFELKDKLIPEINNQSADFICVNFANPDMVGHTGVFKAAIIACETIDKCLKDLVKTAQQNDYTMIVIADHGNSETMLNKDGTPHTAHTTNPVPIIIIDKDIKKINSGILGDIAPTILKLMGLKQPKEMTQKPLI